MITFFHHDSGDGDGKEGTGNGDFRAADPASIRDFSRVRTFLENEIGRKEKMLVFLEEEKLKWEAMYELELY